MREISAIWLIVIFVIILVPFSLNAEEKLELSIRTDRTEFLLGEPVLFYVSLKNNGTTPVEVMQFLEPDYGFVKFEINKNINVFIFIFLIILILILFLILFKFKK